MVVEKGVNIVAEVIWRLEDEDVEKYLCKKVEKWDQSVEFRKYATESTKTMSHFQRKSELKVLFPTIYKEMESLGVFRRFIGEIDFLVYEGEYGFINCKDVGRVYFSKRSLIDPSIWKKLKKGDPATFGVILPGKKEQLPHAIYLEVSA